MAYFYLRKIVGNTMDLRLSKSHDLEVLLQFVELFHESEGITMSAALRRQVLDSLLGESTYGRIWVIEEGGEMVGYIALCFGYAIEWGGRYGLIDEFYLRPEFQGKGLGFEALSLVRKASREMGIRQLALEVAHTNIRARRLYERFGFEKDEDYAVMTMSLR